jgi:hypothetical protein
MMKIAFHTMMYRIYAGQDLTDASLLERRPMDNTHRIGRVVHPCVSRKFVASERQFCARLRGR